MNRTELLTRAARSPEERLLLGRVLDRLEVTRNREVPAHTAFLSPAERQSVEALLRACGQPRHVFLGGYSESERRLCLFLPDWQPEPEEGDADGPVAALRAAFPRGAELSHRDVLGALMGLGITRENIGDIILDEGACYVLVLRRALPILLSQWDSVGRYRVEPAEVSPDKITAAPPEVKLIRDTVAALRLDAVAAIGFSMARGRAADLVEGGKVLVNHSPCDKPDRQLAQGDVLSCRGLGKCVVKTVGGLSRKGRIMLEIERYL